MTQRLPLFSRWVVDHNVDSLDRHWLDLHADWDES
jgi:hypothetical protein